MPMLVRAEGGAGCFVFVLEGDDVDVAWSEYVKVPFSVSTVDWARDSGKGLTLPVSSQPIRSWEKWIVV